MIQENENSAELEKKGTADAPESLENQTNESVNEPKAEEAEKVSEPEETAIEAEHSQSEGDTSDAESEDDQHEDEEDEVAIDYSKLDKAALAKAIEDLLTQPSIPKIEKAYKEILPLFQEIKDEMEKAALERFVADGGEAGDFQMHWDEDVIRFEKANRVIKERRSQFYQEQEKSREQNLAAKNAILERLREIVDGEETVTSISALKQIQTEWKKIGQVPSSQVRELWASYHALIDRFYDQRSIYFELKELDRKKNLEAKAEICEKAEKLDAYDNIREAIKELNDLHEEFKHLGPVPKEEQEAIWGRFKAASDKIYAKRKLFNDQVKKELTVNLKKKLELVEKVEAFAAFNSDRINDWNAKTRELLDLQKVWDGIGGMPKEKAKDVNKKFWSAFKGFFQNKNQFFKRLESMRAENLEKKKNLIAKAEELKNTDDIKNGAEEFKKLQNEWKKVGPVPEKIKDQLYNQFKAACDHFFNRRRENQKSGEKVFVDNLKAKEALCEEIEKATKSGDTSIDRIEDYLTRYTAIGYVPRDSMSKTAKRFGDAIEAYAGAIGGLSEEEIEQIKVKIRLFGLKNDPDADRKIQNREGGIRKRISTIENEIVLWKNNMEFFASSANAEKLKKDFQVKINKAQEEIEDLKRQLDVLREF